MTKEIQTVGERFFEVMTWWQEGVKLSKTGFVLMGKAIYIFKKEKLWRKEIEHIPTFKYWVEHSLHISVAQAHRLAQVYVMVGYLLEEMSISVDISKITLLLPYMAEKTDAEKRNLLEMASICTIEDIKNNIKEMTGNKDKCTDVCPHSEVELITRCRQCGKWLK